MFRGCVSSLVIVGLLASFLAAVPHVHAGMSAEERREHDVSRHLHHLLLGHAHHDHEHEHDHHHRTHADVTESTDSSAAVSLVPEGILTAPAEDHGLCLHAWMPLAAGDPGQSLAKVIESQVLISTDSLPSLLLPQAPILDVQRWDDCWHDGTGLYLALRHLRL